MFVEVRRLGKLGAELAGGEGRGPGGERPGGPGRSRTRNRFDVCLNKAILAPNPKEVVHQWVRLFLAQTTPRIPSFMLKRYVGGFLEQFVLQFFGGVAFRAWWENGWLQGSLRSLVVVESGRHEGIPLSVRG